jgi:hypothetical protein
MPDDGDSHPVVDVSADGENRPSLRPAPSDAVCDMGSRATRALVDGLGVYTAYATSPFLTAPSTAKAASSPAIGPPDVVADPVQELMEPVRRQLQAYPLRLRLSEEELGGLVKAVLDVVARYIALGHAEVRRWD